MIVQDLFLKHVDRSGSSRIEHHRVWDGERFFSAIDAQARKSGGHVELSSQSAYRAAKWPGHRKEPKP